MESTSLGLKKFNDGEYGWQVAMRDNPDRINQLLALLLNTDLSVKDLASAQQTIVDLIVTTLTASGAVTFNGPLTIGGVTRNTWPDAGNGSQALADVLANGPAGNIPAGQAFELKSSDGTTVHVSVDEATGEVTIANLTAPGILAEGEVGNISNPDVQLLLNQLKMLPFSSASYSGAAAATDVTNYVGLLKTKTLPCTPPAGVAAGQFALIGAGVYYPIVTVNAGVSVVVEYDADDAEPAASGNIVFCMWRFRGDYRGDTTYNSTSRTLYMHPTKNYYRAMPYGFPAFIKTPDGTIGLQHEAFSTTNLQSNCEAFDLWAATNAMYVNANAAVAPNGNIVAVQITSGAINEAIKGSYVGGVASDYTFSLFVKAVSGTGILQLIDQGSTGRWVNFDLISGVLDSKHASVTDKDYGIEPLPSPYTGWYRVWFHVYDNMVNYTWVRTPTAWDSFYLWFGQLEQRSAPSSPVLSGLTRNPQSLVMALDNVPRVNEPFSVVMRVALDSLLTNADIFRPIGGTFRILRIGTNGSISFYYGGVIIATGLTASIKSMHTIIFTFDGFFIFVTLDGVDSGPLPALNVPGVDTALPILTNLMGACSEYSIYRKALTAAERAAV